MAFPPKRSLRFRVLLNCVIGIYSNTFPIVPFICKMGQCFCIILDTFGAVKLFVITSGMRLSISFYIRFSASFKSSVKVEKMHLSLKA